MISKSNLWFLTLSSIILVLSVYYIAFPNKEETLYTSTLINEEKEVNINESEELTALKVMKEEENIEELKEYQNTLLTSKEIDKKNEAYENILNLNNRKSSEDKICNILSEKYQITTFINIKENNLAVTVFNVEKDISLANKIIKTINEINDNYYISVKFN